MAIDSVTFRYGPVELFLVGYEGEGPDAASLAELGRLVETGHVRVLDLIVIAKTANGDVTITEVAEVEDFDLGIELLVSGLIGEEDIVELAELVPPGTSATLAALELTLLRSLSEKVAASGGVILADERIPAPIVNAIADVLDEAAAEITNGEE